MNGAHDLGGDHGHGSVAPDPDEPIFAHEWERRAFALTLAMGFTGEWNIDQSRFARERMDPAHYLGSTYYEHWLHGLAVLMGDRGLLDEDSRPVKRVVPAADVPAVLARGASARRMDGPEPRFAVGQSVRARNIHPRGHTRLPRYVRGHLGRIERFHGNHVFPDANAKGEGEHPQACYAVRFEARELWGPDADPNHSVMADLWDDHLDPA